VDVLVTDAAANDKIVQQLQADGLKNVRRAGPPGSERPVAPVAKAG
jgi:hypothetical protein